MAMAVIVSCFAVFPERAQVPTTEVARQNNFDVLLELYSDR